MELIRLSKMNLYYRFATQHEIHIFSLSSGVDFYSPTQTEIENVFSLELKDKNGNLRNRNLWKEEFSIIQEKRPFSRLTTKGQLCVPLSSSKVLNLSSHVTPTKTLCVWRSFINPYQHVCMWEIHYVHFCLLGCVWMNISVNIQTFTRQPAAPIKKKGKKKSLLFSRHSESPSSSSGINGGSSGVCCFVPPALLVSRCSSLTVRMRMSMASIVLSSRGVEENHSGLLGTQQRSGWR